MFNRNQYIEEGFQELMEPDETYCYYFYAPGREPQMIAFTNKRLIVATLDAMSGEFTGEYSDASLEDVKDISFRRGRLKTKVGLTTPTGKVFKLKINNICIGLSNHKKNLIKLAELYS